MLISELLDQLPAEMPCPVCYNLKKLKLSKKRRPYWTCNDCWLQVFARGDRSIEVLKELNKISKVTSKFKGEKIAAGIVIQTIQRKLKIKSEIKQIRGKKFILTDDDDFKKIRSLEVELDEIQKILNRFSGLPEN